MTLAATRRIPAPLSVLTALVVLTLSTALALVGAPAHAASPADGSSALDMTITADVVIKSDDTYSIKMVVTDSTGLDIFNKENCKAESFAGADVGKVDAKADFKEEGDKAICTIEGSGPIKDSDGQIKHEGKEYVVKLGNEESSAGASQLDVTQTITFPGKVTEGDGGKVEGNKVTFTDLDSHTVKGGDGSTPVWVWILIAVGALVVIGGGAAAFFITRSKNNKGQPSPYGPVPTQGYDPNPAFQAQPGQPYGGQPGQQAGYSAPQAQPGQPYGGQPGPSY